MKQPSTNPAHYKAPINASPGDLQDMLRGAADLHFSADKTRSALETAVTSSGMEAAIRALSPPAKVKRHAPDLLEGADR